MKRFLLLALTAGLLSPIAAKAESIWLMVKIEPFSGGAALEKIQMKNMNQRENEMKKLFERWDKVRKFVKSNSSEITTNSRNRTIICFS